MLITLPCGDKYSEEFGKPKRFWFYRPQLHWHGWKTLLPMGRGSDEWCRYTIIIGWTITGRIIIPLSACKGCSDCGSWVNGVYDG